MSSTAEVSGSGVGVERAEKLAREHPNAVRFGRVGWVAKGAVYALTGVLSLLVALRPFGRGAGADEEASQSGAVATIAEQPLGRVLLVVLAIGLVIYAVWRIMSILMPADNDAEVWANRAGYAVSAATYLFLAWSAISFVRQPGGGETGEDARVERLSRAVLGNWGGQTLLVIIGLAVVAIGVYFLHKGVTASFESELQGGGVGPVSHTALVMLGRIGWVGRAAMMGLIGFFLTRAALTFDPDDANGLDGSLRKVADTPVGMVLVIVVAVGLLVYGLFCVLSAPRQRLVGADH